MEIGKIKKAVFFVVVLILLVVLGVFLWRIYGNSNPDIGLVRFEEFTVEETSEGKIIRHQDTGFSVSIPLGWEVFDGINSLFFRTSDFKLNSNVRSYDSPIPEEGCVVNLSVKKEKRDTSYDTEYSYLKNTIKSCLDPIEKEFCKYELIQIDGKDALRYIYLSKNELYVGNYVWVKIPENENVYIFETYLFGKNKEECSEELNKILETVKIG